VIILLKGGLIILKNLTIKKKRKMINCPNCESSSVKKTLVAPNVSKKSNPEVKKNKKTLFLMSKKIKKIVIVDDGIGMDREILSTSLQFGISCSVISLIF
jgi:hypothetical protein